MNETTVALGCLLVVLVVAAVSTRTVAVLTSLVAFAVFNFFFLAPVGTFAISKQDDLVGLIALLAVSLIGSHLSQQARRRAEESLILERQRNEAEVARRSAETKSALVASLSHDVKTPLTALTVAAGNLGAEALSAEERAEQLQIVRVELARLTHLFENVIDMASVEADATRAELEWVNAADIIEAARLQVEGKLAAHPVHVLGDPDKHLVRLDPRLTASALAHVLENAAMYSPPTAPIVIEVALEADHLRIAVRDRGPGILATELDRIFDRFYRGSLARHDSFSTGMGLAITRGLLTLQAGSIVAANGDSGGAVFTLRIPAETRPVPEASLEVA